MRARKGLPVLRCMVVVVIMCLVTAGRYAVYTTFYALQFSCLGLAKSASSSATHSLPQHFRLRLAVLDRLLNFIHTVFSPSERSLLRQSQVTSLQVRSLLLRALTRRLQRSFIACVIVLNVVGLAASVAAIV